MVISIALAVLAVMVVAAGIATISGMRTSSIGRQRKRRRARAFGSGGAGW